MGLGMQRRIVLPTLLALTACGGPELELEESSSAVSAQQVYDQIKALEGQIPTPQTSGTVFVGWIDGQSGAVWLDGDVDVGGCQAIYPPLAIGNPNPAGRCDEPVAHSNAVSVSLEFRVFNAPSRNIRLVVNGRTHWAPVGAETITVPIGTSVDVHWAVYVYQSGNPAATGMRVERPRAAIGAFTIPVMPIALIYEPPQSKSGAKNRNWAEYHAMTTVGSAFSIERGRQNIDVDLEEPLSAGTIIGALAPVADKVLEGAGGAFSAISAGLGNMDRSRIEDVAEFDGHNVSLSTSRSTSIRTTAGWGPGRGDLFFYLTDVKMAWVYDGQRITLTMLDYAGEVSETAAVLKQRIAMYQRWDPRSPQLQALQNLLALDPFATGGAYATPRGSRFDSEPYIRVNGSARTDSLSRTITRTDQNTTKRTSTVLENYNSGWLSFLGLGETRNGSKQLSLHYKSTRSASVGQSVGATMYLHATGSERYTVYVWYDRVFNTWASRGPFNLVRRVNRGRGAN